MTFPPRNLFLERAGWPSLPSFSLLFILALGSCYAVIMPPFQVPDEFGHFFRSYGISEGDLVARPQTAIPASLQKLSDQFPPHLEKQRTIAFSELGRALHEPLNPAKQVGAPNQGTNLNAWLPYLPSAAAIGIARLTNAPPLATLYLGRFANLAAFGLLVWSALKLLPEIWPLVMSLALVPMILHQAASLSWDSVSFGLAILFVSLVVRLAVAEPESALPRPHYAALLIFVCVISLCKVDVVLLPLLLLIPEARFGSRRNRILFLAGCLFLSLATSLLWQHVNRENYALFEASEKARNIVFPGNIWYAYFNTGYLIDCLARTIHFNTLLYLTGFIGTFGWLAVSLSPWAMWTNVALLIFAAVATSRRFGRPLWHKAVLGAIVVTGALSVVAAMWMAETPESYIRDVVLKDIGTFSGIQGRHFVPFAVPALLLLPTWGRLSLKAIAPVILLGALAVNFNALHGIEKFYYTADTAPPVPAQARDFSGKLVRKAGSSPEDSKVYVVLGGYKHWVIDAKWITEHHYKWPDDVTVVSNETLDAIPAGDAIP